MLTQELRPKTFSDVVGEPLNNKVLMALAHNKAKGPSTILLQGLRGSGKAQPITTIIPTPEGSKQLKDIKKGDYVFDKDGNPTKVLEVYNRGYLDCYTVYFDDGRKTKCCNEHLWSFYNEDNELITDTLQSIIDNKYNLTKYRIPLCKPVKYKSNPISGTATYLNNIPRKLPIPKEYLYSSSIDREEFCLQFLIKTATILDDKDDYFAFVYSESKSKATSILQLLYSLGYKASLENTEYEELPYKINIYHPRDCKYHYITKIEKGNKKVKMSCLLVDNPLHLYLTNDFIVTHNTTSARLFARAVNCTDLKKNDICGECQACKADLNSVPWYSEYDSSAMGKVDSIRELRDIFQTTSRNYTKVIVIDEFQLVSKEGQSALLKLFEETPRGIFFILATTDPDMLLPTIRSRSLELIYSAKAQEDVEKDIKKQAEKLGLSLSDKTISLIATRSHGIMRDAHLLLDKVSLLGEEDFINSDKPIDYYLFQYVLSVIKSDADSVLKVVNKLSYIPMANLKDDWQKFFMSLIKTSLNIESAEDDVTKKVLLYLNKHNLIIPLMKMCLDDWVIQSFSDSLRTQAMLLTVFQEWKMKYCKNK